MAQFAKVLHRIDSGACACFSRFAGVYLRVIRPFGIKIAQNLRGGLLLRRAAF